MDAGERGGITKDGTAKPLILEVLLGLSEGSPELSERGDRAQTRSVSVKQSGVLWIDMVAPRDCAQIRMAQGPHGLNALAGISADLQGGCEESLDHEGA